MHYPPTVCPVVELRQYTFRPGTREAFVRLFDAQFVEGQEEHGIRVLGQFRDLGKPDRYVWMRGFSDMEARRQALEGFYTGPVWKRHRDEANAGMIEFDDVLLLKPAGEDTSFRFDSSHRRAIGDPEEPGGVVVATIHHFAEPVDRDFPAWFRAEAVPVLAAAGTSVLAQFVTESAPNTYPGLPVREGEYVFVWFAAYPDRQVQHSALQGLEREPAWSSRVLPALEAMTKGTVERLLLTPTPRSLIRFRPE